MMTRDPDDFRRRAAEARSAALQKDDGESIEVAGQLALAYAALARRRSAQANADAREAVDTADASIADPRPLMFRK